MLETRELTVTFGHTIALDAIDVSVASGITGLFGPNGSGKSTLLRVLAGLLRPTKGSVHLDGEPASIRSEDYRRAIGYAGHEAGLYAELSVRENLELFASLYGADPDRVDGMIEQLGLGDVSTTEFSALSAGTKRRAAVARALLHEPRVLLLDEPYANLDDEAADLVDQAIRSWSTPKRIGVVASHGAKRVKSYASGGVILRRSRVIRQGTYEPAFTAR